MYTIQLINIRVWAVKQTVCPSLKKETWPNKFDINMKQLCPLSIFKFQLVCTCVTKYTYGTHDNNIITILLRFSMCYVFNFNYISRKMKMTFE